MFRIYVVIFTIFIFNDPVKSIDAPVFTIPLRSMNGTAFGNSIMNVGPNQTREDLIFAQYQVGNVPDFMRNAISVTVTSGNNTLIYWVLPDVLSVGIDTDYLRTSINPFTARKIADLFGCILPTSKMAYQIWQAATVKLEPSPNGPPYDVTMQSTERMVFHNKKIQTALGKRIPGELITGHKKDVVISIGLLTHPNNVAIVGWWYPSGQMIQPLNYVSHDRYYKDYSHGIRLVNRMVTINGQWYDVYDVLRNETLAPFISDEGAFDATHMYT
jgi:hypothetical protein